MITIRSSWDIFYSLIQGAKESGDAERLQRTRRRACDARINGRAASANAFAKLSQARNDDMDGQPKAIRALNCIEDIEGSGRQYTDSRILRNKLAQMTPAGKA